MPQQGLYLYKQNEGFEMKKNYKRILLIVALLLIFLVASIKVNKSIISPEAILYRNIEITNDSLLIKGDIVNSYGVFDDYSYIMKEDKLYITIYQSNYIKTSDKTSEINIFVKDDFTNVKKIYQITSNSKDANTLIWPK